MSVYLSPAFSIVVKRSSWQTTGCDKLGDIGDIYSEDTHLIVLGPFFSVDEVEARLKQQGLVYFDDYFDIQHSGGEVPSWCRVCLELQAGLGTTGST